MEAWSVGSTPATPSRAWSLGQSTWQGRREETNGMRRGSGAEGAENRHCDLRRNERGRRREGRYAPLQPGPVTGRSPCSTVSDPSAAGRQGAGSSTKRRKLRARQLLLLLAKSRTSEPSIKCCVKLAAIAGNAKRQLRDPGPILELPMSEVRKN